MERGGSRVEGSVGDVRRVSSDVLQQLEQILESRKYADPGESYVASLYERGPDAVLKKVGEEAAEVLLAAKNGDNAQIVHETADLWFHTLIMLVQHGVAVDDVLAELTRRFGVSGHDEKASRRS